MIVKLAHLSGVVLLTVSSHDISKVLPHYLHMILL